MLYINTVLDTFSSQFRIVIIEFRHTKKISIDFKMERKINYITW